MAYRALLLSTEGLQTRRHPLRRYDKLARNFFSTVCLAAKGTWDGHATQMNILPLGAFLRHAP
jgi:hypothetical protein